MLHQIGLYFHILAVLLVGAGGIGGAIVERQFWKNIKIGCDDARAILPILTTTRMFILIGIITFLVSGLTMLYSVHWAYLYQPWFIAKFILFLCLPFRAGIIAQPIFVRVGSEVQKGRKDLPLLLTLKRKLDRFHIIQYSIVLVIMFLVIFKL